MDPWTHGNLKFFIYFFNEDNSFNISLICSQFSVRADGAIMGEACLRMFI